MLRVYWTVNVKVTVAESAPVNDDPPLELATVKDMARDKDVPLDVAGIDTVEPLEGSAVNGPAVVAASPRVNRLEWVKPGVVTTTVVPLNELKPAYDAVN